MKILIIYDSMFGNTKQIAEAVAGGFVAADTKLLNVSDARLEDLKGQDLVLVGSPTHGGRAKLSTQAFLEKIADGTLAGIRVAVFDTRFGNDQNFFLKFIMKIFGFAATRMAKTLEGKGGKLAVAPEGFIVMGKEGPLKDGELERAAAWAKQLS